MSWWSATISNLITKPMGGAVMKKTKLIIIGVVLAAVAGLGLVNAQAATVDRTRDCDKFAVVYCGTMSISEAREKYSQKDHAAVFKSFGINKAGISGDIRKGVVYQDGRVVVGGKTVATGAVMAARHLGGSSISGSSTAKRVSVSKMGSAQEALVKFNKKGEFEWAIMTPCGNPVNAKAKKVPQPAAKCSALTATKVNRTTYKLVGKATVTNGATVKSYTFTVKDASGKTVFTQNVPSTKLSASTKFTSTTAGKYTATVAVNTSAGNNITSNNCAKSFTIEKEVVKTPGVSIDKKVDGVEHKKVTVDQEFTYQLVVKNTGQVDLANVKVSDPAPANVAFISADKGTIADNNWNYTIPQLKVGASVTFSIKAKVIKEVEGTIKNTACVDAPQVPGNPDDCDDATVEVPPKNKIEVCDLVSKQVIWINEDEFDDSKHSKDPEDCKEVPVVKVIEVCDLATKTAVTINETDFDSNKHSKVFEDCEAAPVTPETPKELPKTGPIETISSIIGLGALIASSGYYIASRRTL